MLGLSAIECFVFFIAIYIGVYWIMPRKAAWVPMLLLTVLLSVLAYYTVPNGTDDLARYYVQLDYLREYGREYLDRCFQENINEWKNYRVCGYYFYFISKFPNNNWMQTVTMFLCYGLMFLVLYKAAQHFAVGKTDLFWASMFFLSTYWYYDTLSGIRNGLAFAVIFACTYYHLVERKRVLLCYVGYLLACQLHSAGIIIVLIVLLTVVTMNSSGRLFNFMLMFGVIAGAALIRFLSRVTNIAFFGAIAGKVDHYMEKIHFYTDTNFLVNIVTALFVALLLLYFSYYFLTGSFVYELRRFYKYAAMVMFFLIGSLLITLVFMRISRWIIPMLGALIYMIGKTLQREQIETDGIRYCLYFAPQPVMIRTKLQTTVSYLFFGYILLHFWYLCAGSSLHWMHF